MLVSILAVAALELGLALNPSFVPATPGTAASAGPTAASSDGWAAVRSTSCASPARRTAAVRSAEEWLKRLIEDGVRRSPTFARLATTIDDLCAIVHVEPRNMWIPGILAAVPHSVTRAPDGTRYVRVWVVHGRPPDEMVETIGHELQHVVEILRLESHGTRSESGAKETRHRDRATDVWIIETEAARQAGQAVHQELLTRTRTPGRAGCP